MIEEEQQIEKALTNHFNKLFQSTATSKFDPILQGIEAKVTDHMNEELTRSFTEYEVEQALKQMKALTTPRLDDMPPLFYKTYWNIVVPDVVDAALSVLNSGIMPSNINHTFICVNPKVKSPESPKDFRPISLCNVMYKIISKTIANRLKKNST